MARFSKALNLYSKTAKDLGINNTPGVDTNVDPTLTYEFIMGNLESLHKNCVGPIMDHFNSIPGSSGNSIGISCGYRCMELNRAIKPPGSRNSQHIYGYAIDLIYIEGHASEIFNWSINNLPSWSQIIWEFPEKGRWSPSNQNCEWIHISYQEGKNKRTKSVATIREDIHKAYTNNVNTNRKGSYTHGITDADQTLV